MATKFTELGEPVINLEPPEAQDLASPVEPVVSLEEFLKAEAGDLLKDDWIAPIVSYEEDVNDDAKSDAWLENNSSYIWKVGVLSVADGNKRDWAYLFI